MQTASPNLLLQDWLNTHAPVSIVSIGREQPPALKQLASNGDLHIHHIQDFHNLSLTTEIPQAVVISECLESLTVEEGRSLLADIRNHLVPQVLLFIDHAEYRQWEFSMLIGLGFKKLARFEQGNRDLCCYSYDIDLYNPRRTWNNAKHWANPELFGKYWW